MIRSFLSLFTLKCRDSASLISASLDGPISRGDRWALRIHLVICAACRRYRRQVRFLHWLLEQLAARLGAGRADGPGLSEAAKDRLRALME